LNFDFTDFVGSIVIDLDVTDDNTAGALLGAQTGEQTLTITLSEPESNQNFAPWFKFSPEPVTLHVNEAYSLNLTFWSDVDEEDEHKVSVLLDFDQELPKFIEFDGEE